LVPDFFPEATNDGFVGLYGHDAPFVLIYSEIFCNHIRFIAPKLDDIMICIMICRVLCSKAYVV